MRSEVTSSAPGRICLAGEDLDWITGPAILCAIDKRVKVKLSKGKRDDIQVSAKGSFESEALIALDQVGHYSRGKFDYVNAALKIVRDYLGIKLEPLNISISSDLPVASGLASSAAISIATIGALSGYFEIDLPVMQVCKLANLVESEELLTGAGQMDFYISGLGGLIYLDSSKTPPKNIERYQVPSDIKILIVDTLTQRNTAEVISEKRERLHKREKLMLEYVNDAGEIVEKIRILLRQSPPDWARIGEQVTDCHRILRDKLSVSTDLLDSCVDVSIGHGALGAKMTGAGWGGCAFALTQLESNESLINELSKFPVQVLPTLFAKTGLIIDRSRS